MQGAAAAHPGQALKTALTESLRQRLHPLELPLDDVPSHGRLKV